MSANDAGDTDALERFLACEGTGVRRALLARYGAEIGAEAWAEAAVWAWEHRERLLAMTNPAGYLFRVGQSAARPHLRWRHRVALVPRDLADVADPERDDELLDALARLKANQRVAVVLVHAYGMSYEEVAAVLETSVTAVTNHVHRGILRLRARLGGDR